MTVNILLEEGSFFTNLPGILLGLICGGAFMFFIFSLFSKVTGTSIKSRGTILGGAGGTMTDPETLDTIGKDVRKIFDKKYRIEQKIQQEYNNERKEKIFPIDDQIISIASDLRMYNMSVFLNKESETESSKWSQGIEALGEYNIRGDDGKILKMSSGNEAFLKLKEMKQKIERELKIKYENKLNDLLK